MGAITDRELIERHLAGDRDALAAIYDRYAAALYDVARSMTRHEADAADLVQDTFVIAATRLDQLRDRDRLKPWLFSVLRHEVYRRSRRRRREQPLEEMDVVMSDDGGASAVLDEAAHEELAALVRDAASGLDERDRLALELSVRQGLEGADLADALGVSAAQSYSIVFRMRQRVERSLGALVVARGGRRDCEALAQVLAGWDGGFDRLVRKRVSRHVEGCDTCQETRRRLDPVLLMRSAPAFGLPIGLRQRVLDATATMVPGASGGGGGAADGPGEPPMAVGAEGFPAMAATRRVRGAAVVGIVLVVLVVVGVLVAVRAGADDATTVAATAGAPTSAVDPSTTPPSSTAIGPGSSEPGLGVGTSAPGNGGDPDGGDLAPDSDGGADGDPSDEPPLGGDDGPGTPGGGLTAVPRALDLSLVDATAVVRVTNTGSVSSSPIVTVEGPFTVGSPGSLAPGAQVSMPVTFNPAGLAEGDHEGILTIAAAGDVVSVAMHGHVDRPPTVRASEASVVLFRPGGPVCGPFTATVSATVGDESAVDSVTLRWAAPGSVGSREMTASSDGRTWQGSLGPFPVVGAFSFTISATDARGNVTTIDRSGVVRAC